MTGRARAYTVSEINRYISGLFSGDYLLNCVSVIGEASNVNYNRSGHIYFTLKDEASQISCVMFSGKRMKGLKFRLENGLKVMVTGRVGVYNVQGRYQIQAENILLTGVGELYAQFDLLKQKLSREGIFKADHKKPLPYYVRTIGVVTADTGKAIRDIIKVTRERNPYVQLILCPAKVQGAEAAESIVSGIRRLDAMGLDVLIVGRGGGSFEELFCFSDERVVRAIYDCRTPVISAVGHDTDYQLSDFVADVRAATPSNAAEKAVAKVNLLERQIAEAGDSLTSLIRKRVQEEKAAVRELWLRLDNHSPAQELANRRLLLADEEERMWQALNAKVSRRKEEKEHLAEELDRSVKLRVRGARQTLQTLAGRLDGMSPLRKVSGGFGYVTGADASGITSVKSLEPGSEIFVRLSDGRIDARVLTIQEDDIVWERGQSDG